MTSAMATLAAVALTASTVTAQTVLWEENFNYNSLPDPLYWNMETGNHGWGNDELQDYTTKNAIVSGGNLKIFADRDGDYFSSARINTNDKVEVMYGTIEARIKVPNVDQGLWPAFWTLGADFPETQWPYSGEIDIMEVGQGSAKPLGVINNRVVSAVHWWDNHIASHAESRDVGFLLYEDFHVYKLEWTPSEMVTYVDDIEIWRFYLEGCDSCDAFRKPHFLVLNLAVGGGFTGGTDSSCGSSSSSHTSYSSGCPAPTADNITASFPAYMEVDYIRILDNGHTEITVATHNPTSSPTDEPTSAPTKPAPQQKEPDEVAQAVVTATPTSSPTRSPTRYPTHSPTTWKGSKGGKSSKGGKGSKGKSGKGEYDVLCSEGKGGKGKSGKGKSGKSKSAKSKSSKGKSGKGKSGKGKSQSEFSDCESTNASLQTKSALASAATVSDWSPALWITAILAVPAFLMV